MTIFRITYFSTLLLLIAACGGSSAPSKPPLDTDGDGIVNVEDLDDDNDGISDAKDAFPLDSSESADSDADGVGDNTDVFPLDPLESSDADSDGYGDNADSFPNNKWCWLETHSFKDGSCDYGATMPNFEPHAFLNEQQNILYLTNKTLTTQQIFYLWSTENESYLEPIIVDLDINDNIDTNIAWSEQQQRLYIGYSGKITYIEFNDQPQEQAFIELDSANDLPELQDLGNYLLVEHDIYDKSGTLTDDSLCRYNCKNEISWDKNNSRFYKSVFDSGIHGLDSNYYLAIHEFDKNTGVISNTYYGNDDYRFGYSRPIVSSSDGQWFIVLGDVYASLVNSNFIRQREIAAKFSNIHWQNNDEILAWYRESSNGSSTKLYRISTDFEVAETQQLEGYLQSTFEVNDKVLLVIQTDTNIQLRYFSEVNDNDNDGVKNNEDAFADDIAAAIDTDNDGFPDEWNHGFTDSDSTSGLTLDSFPNDTNCWLTSHGDGDGNCDHTATLPTNFDAYFADSSGIIYLFNKAQRIVYRWDSNSSSYLPQIKLGEGAKKIHVSNNHQRLYIAYQDRISYISLESEELHLSKPIVFLNKTSLKEITDVNGELLVVTTSSTIFNDTDHSYTNSYDTFRFYNSESKLLASESYLYSYKNNISQAYSPHGVLVSTYKEGVYPITQYENETTYYLRYDSASENVINNVLGKSLFQDPGNIFISETGYGLVNGKILRFDELTTVTTLPSNINYSGAIWNNEGKLLLALNQQDSYQLTLLGSNFNTLSQATFDGTLLALLSSNDDFFVIAESDNKITIQPMELEDMDGDTLSAWWENEHGLSDNDANDATEDGDNDGLSNINEYRLGTSPNMSDTDGDGLADELEVSTYLTLPFTEDSDGDGLTDTEELNVYSTNPLLYDTDKDTYSDAVEEIIYQTSATDTDDVPTTIKNFIQSFETLNTLDIWKGNNEPYPYYASSNWELDNTTASIGNQSLKAEMKELPWWRNSPAVHTDIRISATFEAGELTFDGKVSPAPCCELVIILNSAPVLTINETDNWQTFTIDIPAGDNELTWRYRMKDENSHHINPSELGTAWIDYMVFNSY